MLKDDVSENDYQRYKNKRIKKTKAKRESKNIKVPNWLRIVSPDEVIRGKSVDKVDSYRSFPINYGK